MRQYVYNYICLFMRQHVFVCLSEMVPLLYAYVYNYKCLSSVYAAMCLSLSVYQRCYHYSMHMPINMCLYMRQCVYVCLSEMAPLIYA